MALVRGYAFRQGKNESLFQHLSGTLKHLTFKPEAKFLYVDVFIDGEEVASISWTSDCDYDIAYVGGAPVCVDCGRGRTGSA